MTGKFYENQRLIKAPKEQVWDALVNPEKTEQYMFGSRLVSDWKIGSRADWIGKVEGKEVLYVKGEVLRHEPYELLEISLFPPDYGIEDIPENYLRLVYELSSRPEGTLLKLTQGDYARVAKGEQRLEETRQGWDQILDKLQEVAEN